MKKVLLFASVLAAAFSASAADEQLLTVTKYPSSAYEALPIPQTLNDTVNQFWATQLITGKQAVAVNGLIATTDSVVKSWWNDNAKDAPGQYTFDWSGSALKVSFANQYLDDKTAKKNYKSFSCQWGHLVDGAGTKNDKPTNLYGYTVGAGNPATYTASPAKDTLNAIFADLSTNARVFVTAKATKKTNVRVDIKDKNGRLANARAPHQWLQAGADYATLEFAWDYRPDDGNGGVIYDYEGSTEDAGAFNTGMAVDGWAGDWFQIAQGRYTATAAPLYGRSDFGAGGVALDLRYICGISITFDDGQFSTTYSLEDTKDVFIKDIVVGKGTAPENINPEISAVKSVSSDVKGIEVGQAGTVLTVDGDFQILTIEGTVVASANGSFDAVVLPAAPYVVKNAKGAKLVSIVK